MRDPQGDDAGDLTIPTLQRVAARGQVWTRVAAEHGVTHPLPPWKSSLDGMCDALGGDGVALPPVERRRDEDLLSETVYSGLPAPESQLVALAHSLVARGVIEEEALAHRMEAVRTRLEAA